MIDLSAEELKELIIAMSRIEDPMPIAAFGNPGCGKTTAVIEASRETGRKYFVLSLGRLESGDIKGMPDISGPFTVFKPPKIWNDIIECGGNCILHLDELSHASNEVQAAVLDILQYKKIDDLQLPLKLAVVISGNTGEDGTFARAISSAVVNRTLMYKIKMPTIRQYINYQKPCGLIEKFLMAANESRFLYSGPNAADAFAPFTTPRSLSNLDNSLKKILSSEELSQKNIRLKKENFKLVCTLAIGLLSEETAVLFIDSLNNFFCDIGKLVKGEKNTRQTFSSSDNFKKCFILNQVGPYFADIEPEKAIVEYGLQDFVYFLSEAESSTRELLAMLVNSLLKNQPAILRAVYIDRSKSRSLLAWADGALEKSQMQLQGL
jgi:hypothetical protein